MSERAIVTDSTADIPSEIRMKYNISMVPLYVQVGKTTFKDGEDLTQGQFYGLLDGEVVPTTSSPPPSEFVKVYQELSSKAREIISIHISAKASATCQSAALAAKAVKDTIVTIYDSGGVSMGVGYLVLEAAKGVMQGLGTKEILERLDELKKRIHTYVAIPTLKYLRKSGRVTKGQALLGSLLSVKPIAEIKDGMIHVVDRVRSFPSALTRIMDLARDAAGKKPVILAVMHAHARGEAEKFASMLSERLNIRELTIGEVGPVLASHGGPGMVGVVFYTA